MTNVEWGNNINFIFMRDLNSPPPQNNIGGTSTPGKRPGCSEHVLTQPTQYDLSMGRGFAWSAGKWIA